MTPVGLVSAAASSSQQCAIPNSITPRFSCLTDLPRLPYPSEPFLFPVPTTMQLQKRWWCHGLPGGVFIKISRILTSRNCSVICIWLRLIYSAFANSCPLQTRWITAFYQLHRIWTVCNLRICIKYVRLVRHRKQIGIRSCIARGIADKHHAWIATSRTS